MLSVSTGEKDEKKKNPDKLLKIYEDWLEIEIQVFILP